ncbi:MAG: hypothetical protein JNK79_20190 [Chitinophagaceae bacterium]|nr:hypothetical protein [Chitinophagaceae bacterium]
MRRILPFLLFLLSLSAAGQYNNEWIRNTQTYYKFKVVNKGLYRIPKSVLDAAGIGNAGAEFFELWRNGKQVPIYTSSQSGPLASNGYIEFWGEGNDGKPDKALYRNAAYQHSSEISLFTDTAVYFLSVNTNQTGFTYVDPGNDVLNNSLPAETYFIDKVAMYYRDKIHPGFAAVVGEYVYSSSYDKGEFWSTNPIKPGAPLTTVLTLPNMYGPGPDATLRYGTMGDALNPRSLKISVNGNLMQDTVMDYFNDVTGSVKVPLGMLGAGSASVQFENTSAVSTDRLVMSFLEINYPRLYNFNNQKNVKFSLPASGAKYLEISNFNYGSVAPVLFNVTTGERIEGDISTPGIVKLVVPAGGARDFVLVNMESSNISNVTSLTAKTFKRFADAANQGNYLIVSNKVLYNGSHGNNPVDEYKNYRASAAGGGYNVQVVDIDELVDQFAFGIKKNPLAIKNFIRYAREKFSSPIKYVFIIGRGMTYNDYRIRESDGVAEQLNLVPSWGSPASDNMLSSADASSPVAITPIGRLSVVRGKEIEDYLEKIREYELAQKTAVHTLAGREWMKNVVHVTGSSDPYLGSVLCNYMGVYKQIIQDTMYGAKVSTFCKVSTNTVEQINNEKIASLFQEGISILTYFGHSSSTTLEFNLDNPQAYSNQGKYPVFFVNGCNAGNFFTYNAARLAANETLSEKFVLAKQRGSIAFVASTHFGIVNYLNIYLNNLYGTIANPDYGKSLGEVVRDALGGMVTIAGPNDYYARLHAEEITVHGDPAVVINEQPKPDYVLEEPQVRINPAFISVAEESFQLKIRAVNLGKSVDDSIYIEVKRQYPDGSSEVINRSKIPGIRYADSLTLNIPIVATRDKGLNKMTIAVDADNVVDEVTEANNITIKDVFIYEDEARTVYPYNYAIINNATQKLSASTANPLSPSKQYVMELDTTALFNSPLKVTKTTTTTGGLMEFDPGITYIDKKVYYWRVSPVPQNNGTYIWNMASFMYSNGTKEGFNQSHRYQHEASKTERMSFNDQGKWVFGTRTNELFARNATFPNSGRTDNDFSVEVNGVTSIASACVGQSLIFNVFDSVTFKPWKNVDGSGNNLYLSGSGSANCVPSRNYNFEFSYMTQESRKYMMNFMDSIPNGSYVVVRNVLNANPALNTYIDTWQADTADFGSFNSIYHRLLGAGFTKIDSFTSPRSFIFIYKKGGYDFVPRMEVSKDQNDRVTISVSCITPDSLGFITSPVFGPAKNWGHVIWNGTSVETVSNDDPMVEVIGIDAVKNETVLYTMDRNTHTLDLSTVDAATYPEMKLRMRNIDSVSLSPYQLTDWKIHYQPMPEGAIAPNILMNFKDTLEIGEQLDLAVAFKNVSPHAFDSVAVKLNVLDKNNVAQNIVVPKQKPIVSGDTIALRMTLDSRNFADNNTLFLEFNPTGNQPEQYHYNNFLFKDFYVKVDRMNPLLDVTFDGVHILNRDLVSARPHIQIKLKDDAKFLLLNDTALSSVQIRHPDGTIRTYHFDNDTLRFTPATSSTDNSAVVDFFPAFEQQYNPEGDEYELIVNGKDRSGNKAGSNEYRVAFTVITKAMISNMLNYPNPFSTSTAFVFTITGSEIPQNMKVQILTVTGKIVREVTKEELGPLHIGRNITEFKWDGTDQFGQKLANGVYLYRFVTTLNGQRMEKYKAKGDNTDMFFNNGYGKMYLMR